MEKVDVFVLFGGVLMGEKDFLKFVLEDLFGVIIYFGRVFMKLGKLIIFVIITINGKRKLIFVFFGNFVLVMVIFNLFVFLVLRKLVGF